MLRIRQADKRQLVIRPVSHKKFFGFRPDDDNLGFAFDKVVIIAAQLRHVLFAKRSEKAAIENQHDVFPAAKIGEAHGFIFEIVQSEIRRRRVELDSGQFFSSRKQKFSKKTIVAFLNFFINFLYSGLFAEIYLYLRQYKSQNDWRAVVIFPDESFDPGVHPHSREFFGSGGLIRVYLNKLPPEYFERFPLSLLRVVTESDQQLPAAVEKIVKQLPDNIPDPKQQEKIADVLVSFLLTRLTNLSREEIEKMFVPILSDIKESRAYQEIAAEVKLEVTQQVTDQVTQQVLYQSKHEIALAMIKEKMNPALISKLTGLSEYEVVKMSKEFAGRPKPKTSRASKAGPVKSAKIE